MELGEELQQPPGFLGALLGAASCFFHPPRTGGGGCTFGAGGVWGRAGGGQSRAVRRLSSTWG